MRLTRRTTAWITTVITALTLSAPALAAPPLTESLGGGSGELNWTAGTLTVTGSGAPPDRGSLGQRRLLAERAAVVDGYRQLAELIHGVRVSSETVVKDFTIESDVIRTQVSALVRGAQKVDTRYLSDGSVEVDLQVSLYGPSSLFAAVDFNRKIAKPLPLVTPEPQAAAAPSQPEPAAPPEPQPVAASAQPTAVVSEPAKPTPRPEPAQPPVAPAQPTAVVNEPAKPTPRPGPAQPPLVKPTPPAPQPASLPAPNKPAARSGKAYTGLIIDCRELGMQAAMSPTILDEAGKELYVGKLPIDPDKVIEIGIVGYATALDEAKNAKDRIGDNPLIVKAKKTAGHFKADAILSAHDAQALLDASKGAPFLTQSRVMFILKP